MRGGDGLPRVLPSEADVRAEQESARFARGVTVAALVDAGHVLLVEQVVAVQPQRHVIVHRPRDHGVVHRVGLGECRRADGAVGTAVHAGGIAHAAAQGNAMRQHVAGPAGEGIVRARG
ncbi:hypothetical protein G6F65_020709 [Rhizopus arrhizus]|nr:hypothetical protein G6F65_020709 [Rhizopus arrhizus]